MPVSSSSYPFVFQAYLNAAEEISNIVTTIGVAGPGSANQYKSQFNDFYYDVFEYRGVLWAPVRGGRRKPDELSKSKVCTEFYRSSDNGHTWTKPYAFDESSPTLGNGIFTWGFDAILSLDATDPSRIVIGYYADQQIGWNDSQSNDPADYPFTIAYLHMDTGVIETLPVASGGPTIAAFDTRVDGGVTYYVPDDNRRFAAPQKCGTKIIVAAHVLWFSPISEARHSQYWAFDTVSGVWEQTAIRYSTDLPADVGTTSSDPRVLYTTIALQPTGNSTTAILVWEQTDEEYSGAPTVGISVLKARTVDLTTYVMGPIVTLDSSATLITLFGLTESYFAQEILGDFIRRWVNAATDEWWVGIRAYATGDYGVTTLPTVWRLKLMSGVLTTDYFRISTPDPWYSDNVANIVLQMNAGIIYAIASAEKNITEDAVVLWTCNPAGGNTTFNSPMQYFALDDNWNDTIMGGPHPPLPADSRDYWPSIVFPRLIFGRLIGNYVDSASATSFCM